MKLLSWLYYIIRALIYIPAFVAFGYSVSDLWTYGFKDPLYACYAFGAPTILSLCCLMPYPKVLFMKSIRVLSCLSG